MKCHLESPIREEGFLVCGLTSPPVPSPKRRGYFVHLKIVYDAGEETHHGA